MQLLLLPPDERPVHTRLVRDLAAIAGTRVELPEPALLPGMRDPGAVDGLAAWLLERSADADVAVISLEGLCHGGLIPSRLTDETADVVIGRLGTLRAIRAQRPTMRLDAMAVVTRLPDLDDATEEPPLWATHGRHLASLSRQLDRHARGHADGDALVAARAAVPAGPTRAVMARRARNHALLLAALELVAADTLDTLVLSADDTAPEGLPAREARWLDDWLQALDLGVRVGRYAGADEVAAVRVARWTVGEAWQPRIATLEDTGLDRIAPYEGAPIRQTVAGQVRAVGGTLVGELVDADLVLAVVPPEAEGDHALAPPVPDAARDRRLRATGDRIADAVDAGHAVAVADCAFPNGGSPALVDALDARGVLPRLAAYAGWNTAGNSIGSALAHAVVGRDARGAGTPHERLLVHRLVEDVGYQAQVRTHLRRDRSLAGAPAEPGVAERAPLCASIERDLGTWLAGLGGLGSRWRIAEGSVSLPWGRTFECDLEVEAIDG